MLPKHSFFGQVLAGPDSTARASAEPGPVRSLSTTGLFVMQLQVTGLIT